MQSPSEFHGLKVRVVWRNVKYARVEIGEEIKIIAPRGTDVEELLKSKEKWIEKNVRRIEQLNKKAHEEAEKRGIRILDKYYEPVPSCKKQGIQDGKIYVCKVEKLKKELKDMLRDDMQSRVKKYAEQINAHPEKIYIREQKTKWGSCSSANNIGFNLLLIFTPAEFRDYVAAHEVVHLKYHNHSKDFKHLLKALNVKNPTRNDLLYYWHYAVECKKMLSI